MRELVACARHHLSQKAGELWAHGLRAPGSESSRLWDLGAMGGRWGAMGSDGERWSEGARERGSEGAMERWSDGAMERWSDGAMERWSDGARDRWSEGAMEHTLNVLHLCRPDAIWLGDWVLAIRTLF